MGVRTLACVLILGGCVESGPQQPAPAARAAVATAQPDFADAGPPATVDVLVSAERTAEEWLTLLESSDTGLRMAAALALADHEKPPEGTVAALVRAATAPEPDLRRLAFRALAQIDLDVSPACDAAIPALDDPDRALRAQALRVLGAMGVHAHPALSTLLEQVMRADGWPDLGVIDVLGGIGPRAGERAARAIATAIDGAGGWGGRADAWRLHAMQEALDRVRGPESVMQRVLDGHDGQWHWMGNWRRAVNDLSRVFGKDGTRRLAQLLRDGEPDARLRAATGLMGARWDNDIAVPAFIAALQDPEYDVRKEAAYGLQTFIDRDPRARVALDELAAASDEGRTIVAFVRRKLAPPESPARSRQPVVQTAAALARRILNQDFDHPLRRPGWVKRGDAQLRAWASMRLDANDPEERMAAATILVWVAPRTPGLRDILAPITEYRTLSDLESPKPSGRAWHLGLIRLAELHAAGVDAVPTLQRALVEGRCFLGPEAAATLGAIGAAARDAVPTLCLAARSRFHDVRVAAITALGHIGDVRGVPVIRAELEGRLAPTDESRCGCPWQHDCDLRRSGGDEWVDSQLDLAAIAACQRLGLAAEACAPALRAIAIGTDEALRDPAIRALRAVLGRDVTTIAND